MAQAPAPAHTERLRHWVTFYRRNPHRFAAHYLGLSLYPYQQILLWAMSRRAETVIVASRAAAKSYLAAVFACCRAILYPGSVIVVAAATKRQSRLLVSEKIQSELCGASPALKAEIASARGLSGDAEVRFKNGSAIRVVPAGENSRGNRCNCLIYEECRMLGLETLNRVLSPFLTVRQTPYLALPEFAAFAEEPHEIYLSSAWFRSHWLWTLVRRAAAGMAEGKNICLLAVDYRVTLLHGIRTEEQLRREKEKLDPISWAMEYENRMVSQSADAFFSHSLLCSAMTLRRPFYPRRSRKRLAFPRQTGEIRLLSCDMAFVDRSGNDNSAFSCLRLLPEKAASGHTIYRRQAPYLEAVHGGDVARQALRIRQLFDDFDADYLVLDTRNAGVAVYDILARVIVDDERGTEYPPLSCFNDSATARRVISPGARPVIYAVNASQRLNSEIASAFRATLAAGRIELLISPDEAIASVLPELDGYSDGDADTQVFYERPFYETLALVNETSSLLYERLPQTGLVRVNEPSGGHKDRYTSVSYANYFAELLERDAAGGDFGYTAFAD